MRLLLQNTALPLIGALFFALVAALLGLYWSITSHQDTKAALREALAYIDTRTESDDSLSAVPTDPDDVLDRLRACADGGPCSRDP